SRPASPLPSLPALPPPSLTHPPFIFFFFTVPPPPKFSTSFPTRRSSDLCSRALWSRRPARSGSLRQYGRACRISSSNRGDPDLRSEEHTSELQSLTNLVCRLLLEKKKIE